VITNDAPIMPIKSRMKMNVHGSRAIPINITGKEPRISSQV